MKPPFFVLHKSLASISLGIILCLPIQAMNRRAGFGLSIATDCILPPAPASEHVVPFPGQEQLCSSGSSLILKKFAPEQSIAFHENCSPQTKKCIGMDPEQNEEECLREVHEEYFEKHALAYGIYVPDATKTPVFAGFISIQQDESDDYGQLCYWLCRNFRGRKLIEQAFPLIRDEYFSIFPDRETISAHVIDGNEPSLRKLIQLGFEQQE